MATSVNTTFPVTPSYASVKMLQEGTLAISPAAVTGTAAVTSSSATAGVGYATGAGGVVTQLTSRTTGVALNKTCGEITLFAAAGSATAASFTVTNTSMIATDNIILNVKSSTTNKYAAMVTAKGTGTFEITFWAISGTTSDSPVISFSVVKSVAA